MSSGVRPDGSASEFGAGGIPSTVFIAHASEDFGLAEQVCRLLELDGIGCWIAPRNVRPGHEYADEILDGIETTAVMVLLLSGPANGSLFVKREVERAISKGKVVIPFRIENVEPSRSLEFFISSHQWIDAWAPPLDYKVHILAAAIRGLLGPVIDTGVVVPPPPPVDNGGVGTYVAGPIVDRVGDIGSVVARRRLFGRPLTRRFGIAGLAGVLAIVALVGGLLLMGGGQASSTPSPTFDPWAAYASSLASESAPTDVPARTPMGQFTATGSTSTARGWATAVRLSSGKVLVLGGYDDVGPLATAELYDPATGKFAPTGSMTAKRGRPATTLLNNGQVLIAGGKDANNSLLSSAEVYNPTTGKFTKTGSMAYARFVFTATRLTDGRVLVTGGNETHSGITATAEVYNPATGKFTKTGSMKAARMDHTAVLLSTGRVLILGGQAIGGARLNTAELYDPAKGTFAGTGSMSEARNRFVAVALSDGRVLVAGGSGTSGAAVASAELYNPTNGTFSPTGSMSAARECPAATVLGTGAVLIVGGADAGNATLSSADVFDPSIGSFEPAGSMTTARHCPAAATLTNGKVLVAGGENLPIHFKTAELYNP